jgi:hypothetical protein
MTILDVEVVAETTPVLVGATPAGATMPAAEMGLPRRSDAEASKDATAGARWCLPCFLGGHE